MPFKKDHKFSTGWNQHTNFDRAEYYKNYSKRLEREIRRLRNHLSKLGNKAIEVSKSSVFDIKEL